MKALCKINFALQFGEFGEFETKIGPVQNEFETKIGPMQREQ